MEQSSVVWSSAITRKNINELERVQKVAIRLISKSEEPYKEKLKELNLETLQERRNKLSVRFADKCVKNPKTKPMFKKNIKEHTMKLRNKEKYHVTHARTVRLQKSSIQVMTKHLNKKHKENELMSHDMY